MKAGEQGEEPDPVLNPQLLLKWQLQTEPEHGVQPAPIPDAPVCTRNILPGECSGVTATGHRANW